MLNVFVLQDKGLFSSEGFSAKNLMFKDSTTSLRKLPEITNSYIYLGNDYWNAIHSLRRGKHAHHSVPKNSL